MVRNQVRYSWLSTRHACPGWSPAAKEASVVVPNMAAVIHIIQSQCASVFGEYTQVHLLPYLQNQMMDSMTRVDTVWDRYTEASLKFQTHAKRGETAGCQTRVSAKIPLSKGAQWQKFLKDCQNKDELFQVLIQELQRNTANSWYCTTS